MVPVIDRIERRGPVLLWAVAGYGLATVVFGDVAQSFWLTFVCLALTGATDTVSMVIRNIVRQLETPDRLRGRMTGVNMVFFMGGPQLGELEAGRSRTGSARRSRSSAAASAAWWRWPGSRRRRRAAPLPALGGARARGRMRGPDEAELG